MSEAKTIVNHLRFDTRDPHNRVIDGYKVETNSPDIDGDTSRICVTMGDQYDVSCYYLLKGQAMNLAHALIRAAYELDENGVAAWVEGE